LEKIDQPLHGLADLARLVVVGEDETELAIAAEQVREVIEIDPTELMTAPTSIVGGGRGLLRGVTREGWILIDGERLLADPRLFVERGQTR